MRALFGIVLALAMSPAAGETLLERGAYLVGSVMVCHNCHTPRGPQGLDLSRALSGGSQVFDEPAFKVSGSNITPDKDTGIGNWSDAELKRFLVSGIKPDGTRAAPIMPTEFYTVLTARDLDALAAYLRSVPAIRHETPAPEYRIALKPEVPTYAGKQASEQELADKLARGRYLLTIAHCLECHTPEGPSAVHDFAGASGKGGRTFRGPWGESVSPNITPDPAAGLGQWSDDEIKRAITQGIARDGHKLKPPMAYAAYASMTAQDLDAIVAFLRTLPARN
ncbi:c-type cytochrome [Bradyrhizobium sp. KB893862 SZCCT0404]|uniref:c-type cytochrome n=1 Tax=Bradyrhizobium sp. KB893862 SZCCT0404 TaxID=2807672 RepID=UPI001BAC1408|nr:c-type cytochrome [Bradyrhizobium sp. KB893862 SZCCT0404]MBR1172939.1 c-type cytochrome [Bradyrhizobium sp. KB893862 SZCCT0404]